MEPGKKTEKKESISVQKVDGADLDPRRTYAPLVADLLIAERPLYFDVYRHIRGESQLAKIFRQGQTVPHDFFKQMVAGGEQYSLYVRSDQRDELLNYQEDVLPDLLMDKRVPAPAKCKMLQTLTASLAQKTFENPSEQNIRRQRKSIHQMVDFTLTSPMAVRAMVNISQGDYRTFSHSVNVGIYSMLIALEYFRHASGHSFQEMSTGFFFHDIGKSRISPDILNKKEALTYEEWQEIRNHPIYGCQMPEMKPCLSEEVRLIIRHHHERMDGKGYPDGLKGEQIHPYARICAIADVFDAMTSRKAYRPALAPFKALSNMRESMRDQFDLEIFATLVKLLEKRKNAPRP